MTDLPLNHLTQTRLCRTKFPKTKQSVVSIVIPNFIGRLNHLCVILTKLISILSFQYTMSKVQPLQRVKTRDILD